MRRLVPCVKPVPFVIMDGRSFVSWRRLGEEACRLCEARPLRDHGWVQLRSILRRSSFRRSVHLVIGIDFVILGYDGFGYAIPVAGKTYSCI